MSTILECKNLSKKYGRKQALDNITLSLESGKIIGLLGPNGSGKTTLIKLINGLLAPTGGKLFINGNTPGVESKKIVSYLPERTYLDETQKVSEAITLFEDFYKDFDRSRAISMLEKLNIDSNARIKTLSKGTKEKVEEAIKKLNYEPNIYARGFKINRTNTVALILPTIWNPFFSELAYNIEKNLRKAGMKMILCNSNKKDKAEIEYISMAKQNKMDGVIAITYSDIDEYVSEKIPFVSIDRYFSKDITYISSDNFEGGKLAAEKLVEFGCEKIAYIGRGSKINNATRKRKDGFISYCKEHNIDYEICEILGSSKEFDKLLNEFIAKNFKDHIKIQGVFVVTDEQALDFIHKLEEYDIEVPKDVQVIGFDGSKASAKDTIKISTIRQPVELIAEKAVRSLINIIENNKVEKEIILPISFIGGYTTRK